jgi:hypothetical protein
VLWKGEVLSNVLLNTYQGKKKVLNSNKKDWSIRTKKEILIL